jgi:hypothetical protein
MILQLFVIKTPLLCSLQIIRKHLERSSCGVVYAAVPEFAWRDLGEPRRTSAL